MRAYLQRQRAFDPLSYRNLTNRTLGWVRGIVPAASAVYNPQIYASRLL
jgi:hypothetical protein